MAKLDHSRPYPDWLLEPGIETPLTPIFPVRRNILCVGLNYSAHLVEGAHIVGRSSETPSELIYFTKAASSIIGPLDGISLHGDLTRQLDYELELAVIIGRPGCDIAPDKALSHVFGFSILNDVSARDIQASRRQWFKGKSLDASSPFGPWIVPSALVPDPQRLRMSLSVNGTVRQHSSTAQMISSVAHIISDLSQGMTLHVGDIIATGTPAGCGYAMSPPCFLKEGDVLEAQIDGIGTLHNVVITS